MSGTLEINGGYAEIRIRPISLGECHAEDTVPIDIYRERINDLLYFLFRWDTTDQSPLKGGWEFDDTLYENGTPILSLLISRSHSLKIHSDLDEVLGRMGINGSVLV